MNRDDRANSSNINTEAENATFAEFDETDHTQNDQSDNTALSKFNFDEDSFDPTNNEVSPNDRIINRMLMKVLHKE